MAQFKRAFMFSAPFALIAALLPVPESLAKTKVQDAYHKSVLKRQYKTAAKLLLAAANTGDGEAAYRLGVLYRLGIGVEHDEAKARHWLNQSSAMNRELAVEILTKLNAPTTTPSNSMQRGLPRVNSAANFKPPVQTADRSASGQTWLMRAAARGHSAQVSKLIDPSGINAQDNDGRTALIHAARHGRYDVVLLLLKNGADAAIADRNSKSALMHAIRNCHASTAALLLPTAKSGERQLIDIIRHCNAMAFMGQLMPLTESNSGDEKKRTALWHAARVGDVGLIARLIKAGAAPDAADAEGLQPIHIAARMKHAAVVKALVAAGADPMARTANGSTAALVAAAEGCSACLSEMKLSSKMANQENNRGETPLLAATKAQSLESVVLLLKNGADPKKRDLKRDTPLALAETLKLPDIFAAMKAVK